LIHERGRRERNDLAVYDNGHFWNDAFLMGTAIIIKIAYGAYSRDFNFQKLPSIRLGEVKWCSNHSDDTSNAYQIEIKYDFQALKELDRVP
jgi:hypothetical protein